MDNDSSSGVKGDNGSSGHSDNRREKGRRTRKIIILSYRFLKGGKRHLPPILRGLLGLLLIASGVLGFLPILGFWMVPLGIALLATDVPPLRRWLMKRLNSARRSNRKKRQSARMGKRSSDDGKNPGA